MLHPYRATSRTHYQILGSSPGGNLGVEPDLKLTEEMLELMEGKRSDTYRYWMVRVQIWSLWNVCSLRSL